MRIRALLAILIVAALAVSLTACGSSVPSTGAEVSASPAPGEESKPTPTEPEGSSAPTETASPEPTVKGADSVKTLLEKSLDYFHNDCDYSKISDVHDPQAWLASRYVLEGLYRDREYTWEQAMDKAALLFGSADELREKDPELAQLTMDRMQADEPEEALAEYMEELRNAFQSGEITKKDPDYERLSQLLTDWDKGADYVFSHYPELLEDAAERGIVIGLEGALNKLQRMARLEQDTGDTLFKELECEYRPENTYQEGLNWIYDMGSVVQGNTDYSVAIQYYVRDGRYYLIGYGVVASGIGG